MHGLIYEITYFQLCQNFIIINTEIVRINVGILKY